MYIYILYIICTLLPGPLETTQKAKVLPFLVLLVCVALVVLVVHLVLAVVVEGSSMMTIIIITIIRSGGRGSGSGSSRGRAFMNGVVVMRSSGPTVVRSQSQSWSRSRS